MWVSYVDMISPKRSFQYSGGEDQVFNLGLVIHDMNSTERQTCMNWINQFGKFKKWNFVLWPPYENLNDSAFVSFLKERGLIMGAYGYGQLVAPKQRADQIDSMVETFEARGISVKGVFMFQPDTYSLNYVYEKYGFGYYVGYCFEQYVIDYATMKGGWQLPYYHSPEHASRPAQNSRGLVMFPHVIWDWSASLTVAHHLNTHVLDVYPYMYSNRSQAIDYCLRLIGTSLRCSRPFGYGCTMFEWKSLLSHQDFNETATEYYKQIIRRYDSICQLYNDTAAWFRSCYPATPAYEITFTSPYDNSTIEWYMDLSCRVARYGDYVKSYVVYVNQTDYWLDHVEYINFTLPPTETNSIDNSLKFTIDDLGGGWLRDTAKGGSIYYTGKLFDFYHAFRK